MLDKQPNSAAPQVFLAIAVSLIGVVTLNFLPSKNENKINTSTQRTDSSGTKPITKDFYEILKSDVVVIKETNYVSTPKNARLDHPTLLQISAFGDKKHAISLANKLKAGGLVSVRVITRSSSKGEIHLVRTLPFQRYDGLKEALQIAESFNQHPQRVQIK